MAVGVKRSQITSDLEMRIKSVLLLVGGKDWTKNRAVAQNKMEQGEAGLRFHGQTGR